MRRRLRYFRLFGLMTVVLAIVVGIYFGVRRRGETPSTAGTEPILKATPRIIVAATDLMPRTLITPELLEEREVPSVPEGVFTHKDDVAYRLTTTLIRKGEPIFRQHVTPPLREAGAAYLIPPGQVGMALTISRPENMPPVRSGDYISIHAVFAGMKVRTIVLRAIVLAVNNKVGEISLTPPTQPTPTQQQQQPQPTEKGLTLFVAVSPQEAKSVALAMDSGATFYYTLHPALPLLPPGLERDLTLQELVGSPQVASVIVRKQHGELPQVRPESPQGVRQPPPTPAPLEPLTLKMVQLDRSLQSLHQRVQKLEQRQPTQQPPPQGTSVKERRIVGVVGDQVVTFVIPQPRADGGER